MKKTVVVLFGGQSSEHEVSCMSARTIVDAVDKEKYTVLLIGITKEGRWLYVDNAGEIGDGSWRKCGKSAAISPDAGMKSILVFNQAGTGGHAGVSVVPVDVAIPALHGLYGEDGTVQGLLELAGIPYVGCGVLASAIAMDKLYTKFVVERLGIRQAAYVPVMGQELSNNVDEVVRRVEGKLAYPVFIKPSNAGSSRGVSKAYDREGLVTGMELAARHDRKILVEECIAGRELECAVLGGYQAKASGVGEILAAAEFYDYDAKYNNGESRTVISPELPDGKAEEIRKDAERIFSAIDGYGLARVDFFLDAATGEVVFNEINTLPGFTAISMYPMLWEAMGLSKAGLVEELIRLAFARRGH